MKLNHVNPRIGDTILVEPALSDWAIHHQEIVHLHVTPEYAELFGNHPRITVSPTPFDEADVTLSPSKAFDIAHRLGLPFAAGYFPQIGLTPTKDDRIYYHLHGLSQEKPTVKDQVVIAPFARSCRSHQGKARNLEASLEWWNPIIEGCPLPIVSLGGSEDTEILGTTNLRNLRMLEVIQVLRESRLLVSVETGILHLTSATLSPTIFLSSATPIWFACPKTTILGVVRAPSPDYWKPKSVLEIIHKTL